MSTETIIQPDKKSTPTRPDYGKTIAIKSLTFFQPHPSLRAASSITAESAQNKGKVSIEFVPSLRHHRLEMHSPEGVVRTLMISESHVAAWEPLG